MRLGRSILPLAAYSARVVIYYLQHSIKLSAFDIENAFISSYSNGDMLMVKVCFSLSRFNYACLSVSPDSVALYTLPYTHHLTSI